MFRTKRLIFNKALTLLLALSLLLTAVLGGTVAMLIDRTPAFLNTFLSGLDPTGDLVIRKEITHPFGSGYRIPDGLSFTFTVSLGQAYAEKTVETSQGEKTADSNGNITVTAAPDGAVRIMDILAGTAVTVTESARPGFTPAGGAQKSATVQIGDNPITYTNTYAPGPVENVNLTVNGTKLLEGRDWQVGDTFTFRLEYKLAGEGQDWQNAGTASVSYEPDDPDFNKFSFTELVRGIPYAAAGQYSFRVSEVGGTIGGITYDQVVSYFDMLVGDRDMDGALEIQNVTGYQHAEASYDASAGSYQVNVTINNKYAPVGSAGARICINKAVLSRSGEDQSFAGYTFELYDENGSLVATSAETSAAGETALDLTFEAKDAGKTFHYTLKETHSGQTLNSVTYDSTVYSISVSVVDDLDGTVSAYVYDTADYKTEEVATEPEETEPTEETSSPTEPAAASEEAVVIPEGASDSYRVCFENVYDPSDDQASFGGTKELTGRDLKENEFFFDLFATGDSFDIAEGIQPVQTVANGTDGSFAFAPIGYSKVGTYRYVVRENASDKLGGVTYDDSVFHVTVTVTDECGALKASTVITDELGSAAEIAFHNSYRAAAVSAFFTGTKKLTGADLKADMFRFELYQADESYAVQGSMLDCVSNDPSGQFTFGEITYSEPGTFYYVVKEDVSEQAEGMTYDDTVYGIKISVWDDNAGSLKSSVTMTAVGGSEVDAIVFENSYTKPAAPDDTGTPPTGDTTNVSLYAAIMLASLAAIVVLLIVDKRRKPC